MKEPWQMTQIEYSSKMSSLNKAKVSQLSEDSKVLMSRYPLIEGGAKAQRENTRLINQAQKLKNQAIKLERLNLKGYEKEHKSIIQQALASGKLVPPEVLKDYPELAGKASQVTAPPRAVPELGEARIKIGDVITDGLVNGEVIGEGTYQFGKMKVDAYKIRIISGAEKGKESFINKEDAKLVESIGAKPAKPLPKPTSATVAGVTPRYSLASLHQAIHARRTPKARGLDEALQHSVVISPSDKRVERWKKDPGSADVKGIDTKKIGGNKVIIREIPSNNINRPRESAYKGMKMRMPRRKQRGTDLGAGVYRDGRKQHIRLE